MPNVKSAKKRMTLSLKWAAKNRAARARLRTAIRRVREAEDAETAEGLLSEAISLLDRAARTRLVHPRRTARIKRQLQTRVNALRSG